MNQNLINDESLRGGGGREAKRRETSERIAEVGLRLFLAHGYDATTLDVIANEVGISRRTFFSYFKSKEELLIAWKNKGWAAILSEILQVSPDRDPLDAVRDILVKNISLQATDNMAAIGDLLRDNELLRNRKEANYFVQEKALFDVLVQVWRQPERRPALRLIAMLAVGVLRLSLDVWSQQKGKRTPAGKLLSDEFDRIRTEI
ncbi:hypothetical protein PS834_00945 [Pseudomonas fluorescens]|nr:hypothetical protein PS834_00945 [Pseudomonas fluorescens]